MKNNIKSLLCMSLILGVLVVGCSKPDDNESVSSAPQTPSTANTTPDTTTEFVPALHVSFGRGETPFTMNLYDNETARTIAGFVGTSDWNLPIYHFDDYENYEVMQYYDIPERYDIPSQPEEVTTQKAGEVYYSEPNRIVLFYRDANITGEYTKLGYFDVTDAFVSAVEDNPVISGYSNKIISIRSIK